MEGRKDGRTGRMDVIDTTPPPSPNEENTTRNIKGQGMSIAEGRKKDLHPHPPIKSEYKVPWWQGNATNPELWVCIEGWYDCDLGRYALVLPSYLIVTVKFIHFAYSWALLCSINYDDWDRRIQPVRFLGQFVAATVISKQFEWGFICHNRN